MKQLPADKILRLDALLRGARSVAIITHTHPDGDALGSTTALWHFLTASLGKKARILVPDAIASNLGFIVAENSLTDFSASPAEASEFVATSDLVVCLDFNALSRSAGAEQAVRASKAQKVLIDHHLNPACEEFDLVFSETEISSASELLYYILLALPFVGAVEKLPEEARRALMVGMTTDTNNFANSVSRRRSQWHHRCWPQALTAMIFLQTSTTGTGKTGFVQWAQSFRNLCASRRKVWRISFWTRIS